MNKQNTNHSIYVKDTQSVFILNHFEKNNYVHEYTRYEKITSSKWNEIITLHHTINKGRVIHVYNTTTTI